LFRKAVCGILLILLFIVMFLSAINIKPAKAEWTGTVYIRADGSIDPPDAPISTVDNITYIFTDDIYGSIVVERCNIVIDGRGYTLQGAGTGHGFYLYKINNVTIKRTNIKGFSHGIWLRYSPKNVISGNNIKNNQYGIYLSSYENVISGNNIENNRYGIWLRYSRDNSISGNNIENNGDGIWLYSSPNNSISGNNIIENNGDGICLDNSPKNVISGNNITNNEHGFWFYYSSKNSISGNNIIANNQYGIYLHHSSKNSISGNNITNNGDGIHLSTYSNYNSISGNNIENNIIYIYFSYENSISGNNIAKNRDGIWLRYSSNNSISRNNIIANKYFGIQLEYSSNNSISGNNIENNRDGIYLHHSSKNSIHGNNIENNDVGIWLGNSSNNSISWNDMKNNEHGTWFYYSSNNVIYHNNFIDNGQQVYSYASTNIWDEGYPSGGNYWSDYNGTDLYRGIHQNVTGSDGIGDTPYIIDENNVDKYPLMGPFNSFNTSVGYSVDVVSNSTIEDFRYFESNGTVIMHVSNMTANQTVGFCRLTIPHELVLPPYIVKVNGTEVEYETIYENYTEGISIIYFAYEHSRLEVRVMPEFPSATMLTLLMLTSLIATILLEKKRKPKLNKFLNFHVPPNMRMKVKFSIDDIQITYRTK